MLVKRFFPPPIPQVMAGFERATGRTFPKLRPNARFRETPTFYVANHTAVLADGQDMWWPSHTKALDFELDRWIEVGQTVELEIDGVGAVANRISAEAVPV